MRGRDIVVRDLMTTEMVTIEPTTSIDEARHQMQLSDIRHLPVVTGDGRLVGILSDRDILRAVGASGHGATHVSKIMTQDVLTVVADAPACEATALLLDHKVGGLPVVDSGHKLVGLVTETDFLRVAHSALGGHRIGG